MRAPSYHARLPHTATSLAAGLPTELYRAWRLAEPFLVRADESVHPRASTPFTLERVAQFKGSVFESTRMFCEKELGEGSVASILAELSEQHAQQLREVGTLEWCPVEPVLAFLHKMDQLYGSGDLSVCMRAGQFSAGWALHTVLKVFLRLRSPQWLVEKATSVWGRYHDSGEWQFDATTGGRIVGHLHRFEVRDPAFCARLRGWLVGAIELTGGKAAQVSEPRCVCRGHDHCSFTASWQ